MGLQKRIASAVSARNIFRFCKHPANSSGDMRAETPRVGLHVNCPALLSGFNRKMERIDEVNKTCQCEA
jgi:hypothetical protein